jgi:hypothetical protein
MAKILALPVEVQMLALENCLNVAIKANSPGLAAAVISHGSTVDMADLSPLSAESHPELVKIILQEYRIKDKTFFYIDEALMSTLIDLAESSILQNLLGSNPKAWTSGLVHAITAGKMNIVSGMLEAGVCVNFRAFGQDLESPFNEIAALEAAVRTRDMDMVDLLLACGALPYDDGALRAAVLIGCEIVETLLKRALRSSPYRRAGFGIPTLQLAITKENAAIVDLFLSNDIPTHQLYISPIPGHSRGATMKLTSPGPYQYFVGFQDGSKDEMTALHTALRDDRSRDLDILKMVLGSTPKEALNNLLTWDREVSALEYAIQQENYSAVDLLLELGVDPFH